MVAASRRPRLSPCAPIGGITCAASPTSAMRRAAKLRAVSTPSGNRPRPSSTVHLAEDRMRAPLDLGRQRVGVERAEPLGLGRIGHADEARAQAGQGHQRERAGLGVELGRDAVVRPRVAEIERERGLRVVAPLGLDAGRRAAERFAPVGADHEARRDRRAVVEPERHAGVVRLDRRRPRPRCAAAAAARRRGGRAPRPDAGSRYCGRTPRARSRPPRTAPRARGSAAACRRSAGSRSAARSWSRHSGQTSSASSAATEPDSSAVVRLSARRRFAISAVSTPAAASAIAAVSPAGPPPTTATSTLCASPSIVSYLAPPGRRKRPRFRPPGGLR